MPGTESTGRDLIDLLIDRLPDDPPLLDREIVFQRVADERILTAVVEDGSHEIGPLRRKHEHRRRRRIGPLTDQM